MEGAGVGAPAAGGEEGVAAGGLTEGVVGGAAGAAGEGCDTPGVAGVAGAACCAALLTIVKGAQAISTKIASRPWAKALEIMTRPFSLELSGFALPVTMRRTSLGAKTRRSISASSVASCRRRFCPFEHGLAGRASFVEAPAWRKKRGGGEALALAAQSREREVAQSHNKQVETGF